MEGMKMINKTPEEFLKEPYRRTHYPEENGGYYAEIEEFPGCFSTGETINEVLTNLEETAKSWIVAAINQGLKIPEPLAHQEYNGKIALRLPNTLHQQATRLAKLDGISLNTYLMTAVSYKVFGDDMFKRFIEAATNTKIFITAT